MIRWSLHKTLMAAGGKIALEVNAEVLDSSFTAIYGPSGAGKTSLLRMLAGLMRPDSGSITIGEEVWFDSGKNINLNPQQRSVGMVFQDYALFPNMTVRENLNYALGRGNSESVKELISVMELGELEQQKPDQLSGGQKQRVALARALVRKPKLLLLDEPLAALDYAMRERLQGYLEHFHREQKLTILMVTHDLGEIFRLAENVISLDRGKVIQTGTPEALFSQDAIGGKFRVTGQVIRIQKEEVVFIVVILIGNEVVKVVADEQEVEGLKVGDRVLVSAKAFNPTISRIIDSSS